MNGLQTQYAVWNEFLSVCPATRLATTMVNLLASMDHDARYDEGTRSQREPNLAPR